MTWTRSGGWEKFCAQFSGCTPTCTGSSLSVTAHKPRTNGHFLYFKRSSLGKTSSNHHQTGSSNSYSPLLYSNTSCYKMHHFTLKLEHTFNHRAGIFMPLRLSNTYKQPCSSFLNTHTLFLSLARVPWVLPRVHPWLLHFSTTSHTWALPTRT